MDDLANPSPNSRGVVEHDDRGHAAEVAEDVLQALADAFRGPAAEHLGVAVVAVREGERQVLLAYKLAPFPEVGLAEVALRLAGVPDQLLAGTQGPLRAQFVLHVALDRVVRALVARRFSREPVVDPLRRVALLVPPSLVLLEPRVYQALVGIEFRRSYDLLRRAG